MHLQPNEIRDITKLLEQGKPLPDKYRFLLFGEKRQVELVWNGKTDEVTNVVLPFQSIEHIDEPRSDADVVRMQQSLLDMSGRQIKGWTNKLIWGDNKLILSALKNGPMRKEIEDAGGIKLIYIDPPFDVGADFSMNIEIGDEEFTKKPSVIEEVAYRDTWGKGADSFTAMIYERIKLMYELLAVDGGIYVHCDYRVNSYLKSVLDEVFGKDNFRNEIIWGYRTGGISKDFFARKHDTIFYYAKDAKTVKFITQYYKSYQQKKYNFKGVEDLWDEDKKMWYHNAVCRDVWEDLYPIGTENSERIGYPTQKPEALLERIINASSDEGDLVADFFAGSGTTLSVAEKMGRKWIGTDLGRFGVHTSRKRMIDVQRQLKKDRKDYRAFEILNLGKYERKQFTNLEGDLRSEEKEQVRRKKEDDFKILILSAYKAEPLDGFRSFIGKKRDRLVAVGPIEYPVSHSFVQTIIGECREKGITKADVLGFDYEMGIDFSDSKKHGVDLQFKIIPNEVFDKHAVERGQVKFFDVAYIEVKAHIKNADFIPAMVNAGQQAKVKIVERVNAVAIELTNFSVFYSQGDFDEVVRELKPGSSKVELRNGQIIKVSKDKQTDLVTEEVLTKKWSDWIDYWAVDFNYESKKEIVRGEDGTEKWTGQYVFENEWQSFRTRKNRELELSSTFHECAKGRRKIAVKVIDIFGNDTTKVIEVNV